MAKMTSCTKHQLCTLCLGFVIGTLLAVMLYSVEKRLSTGNTIKPFLRTQTREQVVYENWLKSKHKLLKYASPDDVSFGKKTKELESTFLFDSVKVHCVIFVKKLSNSYALANTWGKRCNQITFFGQEQDKYLDVKRIPLKSSWQYLCMSMRYLWERLSDKLQWILFSPDDVFVIPENLRYFVAAKDFRTPYYLGHNSMFWGQTYNSGKAGYVLSRAALGLIVSKFNSSESCVAGGKFLNDEDYLLGKYLSSLGVHVEDCRDEYQRERFHLFTPAQLLIPGSLSVLTRYSKRSIHPIVQGVNCCSPTSISFQGTQEDFIYFYHYILYNVKVFNYGNLGNNYSATYVKNDEVWQSFIREELGNSVDMNKITADQYYKIWTLKESSPENFNDKIRQEIFNMNHTSRS